VQYIPGGHDRGSSGLQSPLYGRHSHPDSEEHAQYVPSGHEYGIAGSHPETPPVHRHPPAVHSHHSPGGHEYGSPIVHASTGWHEQTSPSQKQDWPAGQAAASNGSQPVIRTHEQYP
jgi:hypothetical protein